MTKPIQAASLLAIVERATDAIAAPAPLSPPAQAVSPAVPMTTAFDYAASLAQIGDDPELLAQLIAVFLEQLPRLLPPIAEAVRRRDGQAIRQTAHALCSSVSVLAAPPARVAARRLELMGLNLELDQVEDAHAQVLEAIARLQDSLSHGLAKKAA